MAQLKRTRNKLLKNGYLPYMQDSSREIWIDATQGGTDIEFCINSWSGSIGTFKIYGRKPDQPEFDLFYSTHSKNLTEAIRLARV
tara:strand:- start:179 stop:433 length:255 start_codon:yes stop_codon:yes gene_type:complete